MQPNRNMLLNDKAIREISFQKTKAFLLHRGDPAERHNVQHNTKPADKPTEKVYPKQVEEIKNIILEPEGVKCTDCYMNRHFDSFCFFKLKVVPADGICSHGKLK